MPATLAAPSAIVPGAQFSPIWSVRNQSTSPAYTSTNGIWQDNLYLSPTPSITSDSLLLSDPGFPFAWLPIAPNATYQGAPSPSIPNTVQPGNYFLIVQVDVRNDIVEADESNNTLAVPIQVVEAPVITGFSPAGGSEGSTVQITGHGFSRTLPSGGVVFASPTGDAPAAPYTIDSDSQISATVPPHAATGLIRLITSVGGVLSPAAFVVPLPDLVPATLAAPSAIVPGAQFSPIWSVRNQSTSPAYTSTNGIWQDNLYLSPTPSITSDSLLLSDPGFPFAWLPIAPNATYQGAPSPSIPNTVQPGNYFLIVQVDVRNDIVEADESNNTLAAPIQVVEVTSGGDGGLEPPSTAATPEVDSLILFGAGLVAPLALRLAGRRKRAPQKN